MNQTFRILVADNSHFKYAEEICLEMAESAKARGTGIAKRSPEYLKEKMREGKAVIAIASDGNWAGFCYIECWGDDESHVANSGLIVSPNYRKCGLAKRIKHRIFELSREKYPDAKIFGLTTGLAVMKINSELGYEPVTYSELTQEDAFWAGCKSCVNYDILMSKGRKNCLCTAMLYNPDDHKEEDIEDTNDVLKRKDRLYERFMRAKQLKVIKNLKMADVLNYFVSIIAGIFISNNHFNH